MPPTTTVGHASTHAVATTTAAHVTITNISRSLNSTTASEKSGVSATAKGTHAATAASSNIGSTTTIAQATTNTGATVPAKETAAGLIGTWQEVGAETACDTSAGEGYLPSSRRRVASLEECKKLCEATTDCRSITYFKSGRCSHFSTPCSNTKLNSKVVASHRLTANIQITTPAPRLRGGHFKCPRLVVPQWISK